MEHQVALRRALDLVRLSVDSGATPEEARTAAHAACRLIWDHKLLVEPVVEPEIQQEKPPEPRREKSPVGRPSKRTSTSLKQTPGELPGKGMWVGTSKVQSASILKGRDWIVGMSNVKTSVKSLLDTIAAEREDSNRIYWKERDRVIALEEALHKILLQCENHPALHVFANLARDAILASNPDATISRPHETFEGVTKVIRLRDGVVLGGHGGPSGTGP